MRDTAVTERRLFRLFEDKLNLAVPEAETDLFETGALDSLMFVDLLFHMEMEFNVKVSLDDLEIENFQSIGRIAEFIAGHGDPRSAEVDGEAECRRDFERNAAMERG